MAEYDDKADLDAAAHGDEASLTRLYERHRSFVFNLSRRFTGNRALRTWLYAVTRNRSVDRLRFSDEMSLEEISRRLEIPLGTVKSRLHYALALLRRRNPVAFLLLMAMSDAAE